MPKSVLAIATLLEERGQPTVDPAVLYDSFKVPARMV
jgi:hypothetical protein